VFDFLIGRGRNGDQSIAPEGEPPISVPPPSIGLALGGGAARGFAHIGVLRTLLAHGIKPDVIAGTSIGALAGGLYAAGHLDAFEEWARGLTRRTMLGYLDLTFFGSGLIRGERLADRLVKVIGDIPIEDLPLRFAAISTEVGTGHEIWLTRGRLDAALQAAYALPGIFAPVWLGKRWLVDGALVNPVPVSAARALGARVVIAVNLNADLFGRGAVIASHGTEEAPPPAPHNVPTAGDGADAAAQRLIKRQVLGSAERPGFYSVMMDAFNIMQDRITRARLAGDPPDASISPRLGKIGLADFHRAAEAIELGQQATERAIPLIEEAIAAFS
jgi:NTE family protein